MKLNEELIKKQNVTEEQKFELLNLYKELISKIEESYNEISLDKIKEIAKEVEDIEFKLQENWNFSKDINYHRYWLDVNHCSCPKMDNLDFMYFGRGKIINSNCLIHGKPNFEYIIKIPEEAYNNDEIIFITLSNLIRDKVINNKRIDITKVIISKNTEDKLKDDLKKYLSKEHKYSKKVLNNTIGWILLDIGFATDVDNKYNLKDDYLYIMKDCFKD